MGRIKKKGQEGTAVDYMTRSRAVRKLQISLQEFRKLCILKGVYPREPKRKVAGKDKTYYLTKDIMFLAHDPVLIKLREQKTWRKRMTKAQGRNEKLTRLREIERQKPKYSLAHIVKERYPTFADALRDLDDTLCLVHLFGQLTADSKISPKKISAARRLSLEFQSYIIRQRALRKVFLSIKGIYYQAEVMGERLIWVVPYKFSQEVPRFVDVGVLNNFFEFSETLMGFVNYKLFHSLGIHYPPEFDADKEDNGEGLFAVILSPVGANQDAESDEEETTSFAAPSGDAQSLPDSLTLRIKDQEDMDDSDDEEEMDGDEEAEVFQTEGQGDSKEMEQFKNLFSKCVFFLSREVPKESLEFVIRSFGGQVSWDGEHAPYDANDARITHYIIDREQKPRSEFTRAFVQPQWVYDSINSQVLLPVEEYGIQKKLPPHLSPFVDDEAEGYTPQRAKDINRMVATARGEAVVDSDGEGEDEGESEDEAQEERYQKELEAERKGISYSDARNVEEEVVADDSSSEEEVKPKKKSKKQQALEEEEQQKQLAKSLIPSRRRRRLYDNIQRSKKVKEERNQVLLQKSRLLEKARRRSSSSK